MASNAPTGKDNDGKETNMGVDYVISYCSATTGQSVDLDFGEPLLCTNAEKTKQRQLRTLRN